MPDGKVCRKCGVGKDISHFSKSRCHALGVQSWCKVCVSAYSKNYRETEDGKAAYRRSKAKPHKPENASALRARNAEDRKRLTERYLRTLVSAQTGVLYAEVTAEMIAAKRNQITKKRASLRIKEEAKAAIVRLKGEIAVLRAVVANSKWNLTP